MGFVWEFDRHLECLTHFWEHVMDACNLCYKQIQLQWQVGRCERDESRDVEQQSHDESSSDGEWGIGGTLETKPKMKKKLKVQKEILEDISQQVMAAGSP